MPPVKQKTQPTFTSVIERKRKLFQCTGFGDCRMVFTRSEHLARHIRKHTGEKPFKCVVPGCNRMFSRFDNMKQHTQTHQRNAQFDYAAAAPAPSPGSVKTAASPPPMVSVDTDAAAGTGGAYNCGGLMSPVSLGSPEQSQLPDMWQESPSPKQEHHQGQDDLLQEEAFVPHPRRLPVADLCNNASPPASETIHLTLDELEALEGLACFRGTPLHHDSLRHLASIACIHHSSSSPCSAYNRL